MPSKPKIDLKRVTLEPYPSSILSSFTRNIESLRSNIMTVTGTEEEIGKIERENSYSTSFAQGIFCGDNDFFQDRVSTLAEAGNMWSTTDVLLAAEEIGTLTNSEASALYGKEKLTGNYIRCKEIMKKKEYNPNLMDKIKRLCKFLSITSLEELENVFRFNPKN